MAVKKVNELEKQQVLPRRNRVVLQDAYDPEEDYAVPHSGSTGPDGKPRYDESPVKGAVIMTRTGAYVNHNGHEIDPEDGQVIDPDRYKEDQTSNLG